MKIALFYINGIAHEKCVVFGPPCTYTIYTCTIIIVIIIIFDPSTQFPGEKICYVKKKYENKLEWSLLFTPPPHYDYDYNYNYRL